MSASFSDWEYRQSVTLNGLMQHGQFVCINKSRATQLSRYNSQLLQHTGMHRLQCRCIFILTVPMSRDCYGAFSQHQSNLWKLNNLLQRRVLYPDSYNKHSKFSQLLIMGQSVNAPVENKNLTVHSSYNKTSASFSDQRSWNKRGFCQ